MRASASIYMRDTEAEEACEDAGGGQVIWSQPGHIWVPWSQKGRKDPLWRPPGESAAPPPPRGQRPGLQPAREEVRFAVICQDATRTRACVSGGSWVCRSLLLLPGPPGPGTGPPLHPRAETETQAWQMRPGVRDHPQRERQQPPALNHAGSRQNSQRGRLLASAWRWAF